MIYGPSGAGPRSQGDLPAFHIFTANDDHMEAAMTIPSVIFCSLSRLRRLNISDMPTTASTTKIGLKSRIMRGVIAPSAACVAQMPFLTSLDMSGTGA